MTDRREIKDAFEHADRELEPSMDRLVAAVPDLVGEARRRRAAAAGEAVDFVGTLVPLAWKAIPRLAAAAVLLLAVSTVFFFTAGDTATTTTTISDGGYEQLILNGSASDTFADPLLEAIAPSREDVREEG